MESSGKFERIFIKLIHEDSSTGGGALGAAAVTGGYDPATGHINSSDFYAPGDARIPKGSKVILTRNGALKKRKKRKKRK